MVLRLKISRSVLSQTMAISAKNLGIITFGINLAVPAMLIPGLLEDNKNGLFDVTKAEITWIGSIFPGSVPLGSLFSGVTSSYLGRRRSLQLVGIPFLACWVLLYFATQIWQIYVALIILGLFGGLVEAPFAAYICETTEAHVRGTLSAMTNVSVAIGYVIVFLMGAFLHWREVMIYSTIFAALSIIALTLVPESPHWLIMNNKEEEARKSLAWLRGWTTTDNVESEFEEICKYLGQRNESNKIPITTKIGYFFKKNFWWPFSLVVFLYAMSCFTGGITMLTYSVNTFKTFNVPIDEYYAALLLGITPLVGSCCMMLFVHKLGKRILVFISLGAMGLCSLSLACYSYAIGIKSIILKEDDRTALDIQSSGYEWIPVVILVTQCFMYYFGLYILPWLLITEVFPYETRSTGCGITAAIANVFSFTANKSFIYIIDSIYFFGAYFLFAILNFVGVAVLYFTLPETEGKSMQDITNHFKGLSRLGNKVDGKSTARINNQPSVSL